MKPPDFEGRHACAEHADLFSKSLTPSRISKMREICDRCPVIPECLAWALEDHVAGFVAGTTPQKRGWLRLKYEIGTPADYLLETAP